MRSRPPTKLLIGLFLVALATLMYEILLTRVFSVTMWYHFAFMAISMAMFGMAVGAVVVYLLPTWFDKASVPIRLAQSAAAFAGSIVVSFLSYLCIPFFPQSTFLGFWTIGLVFGVVAVPFVLSGVCISLALTKFPKHVSTLYASDLAGAAVGCVLLIGLLAVTDGLSAVLFVAAIAGLGAALFAAHADAKRLVVTCLAGCLFIGGVASINTAMATLGEPPLRLMWLKGRQAQAPLWETWNHFSCIRVTGDPYRAVAPQGWGLSERHAVKYPALQLHLSIDAGAGTELTAFNGDLGRIGYLKYDVTNIAHHLRPESDVLVLGAGGGRDILSALAFEQKSVVAVEMNGAILEAVNDVFGDFTGHLDQRPDVTFVNDEARSFVARSPDHFDILQVSLIDTWAATAAGAFVLSENALYTVEAWEQFLERLTDTGVLSVSRWFYEERPGEMYRATSLAVAALRARGVESPRDHILVIRNPADAVPAGLVGAEAPDGVGTILVSPSPFTAADVAKAEQTAADIGFELVVTPNMAADAVFEGLMNAPDLQAFADAYPIDIGPPTDDSPFFFNMLRLRDIFNSELHEQGGVTFNMKAVYLLGTLFIVVLLMTGLCIFLPLALASDWGVVREEPAMFAFFTCIGLGFMLVEISQMQRLVVFLGHPTYGLAVVLFALLLSSGLGSALTNGVGPAEAPTAGPRRLLALLVVLLIFGFVTTPIAAALGGASTPVRIAASVALLFPAGVFMGMAFPLGMTVAANRTPHSAPWLWGVNGATSVLASVLAMVIALAAGISAAFWAGVVCYALALVAYRKAVPVT